MTSADVPRRIPAEQRRVVLHVGLPKCGSSYLQDVLAGRDPDPLLSTVQGSSAYHAVRELLDSGAENPPSAPAWQQIAGSVGASRGSTVISCELLAYADQATAARAVGAFDDVEVHVVVVARDLAALLPSRWQQNVRTGRQESFEDFLRRVLATGTDASSLNPAHVCRTWAAALPAGRVHLVTMPTHGSEYAELWRRFTVAAGIPSGNLRTPADRVNTAMGITSAELVRRLNAHFDRANEPRAYGAMIKRVLVGRTLTGDQSPRPALPQHHLARASELSSRWSEEIREAGYDITGSLADLAVRPHEGGDPATVTDSAILALALESVAALLRENREQARTIRRLRSAEGPATTYPLSPWQRARRALGRET